VCVCFSVSFTLLICLSYVPSDHLSLHMIICVSLSQSLGLSAYPYLLLGVYACLSARRLPISCIA
jgi:hypothetical protein